ncbi:S26 family signal peptidase [Sphingopyxis sp. DHUNG17]|uniref:S26 family signal peptidase n=1 Tax=Sphingopyxis jiangsuensis TaxID=2871171 RepID=UPI00191DE449|nr:S26 family signal peptidase [Sphingopyxis lutea]MBL0770087.1 S26 family signal peptidase [Sphingopyxis lutea]
MNGRWLRTTAACGTLFCGLFGAVAMLAPQPRLLWNASASVPVGLYSIDVGAAPARGDLVAIAPPAPLAGWLAARGYLPRGVPLLKRVAATEGALVCRSGVFVTIDGAPAARARPADRMDRTLPLWLGCRRLQRGDLFLLGASPDSLDGRYFGPIPASAVIGTAHPILTRDAPGAPLRWRRDGVRHPSNSPDKDQDP